MASVVVVLVHNTLEVVVILVEIELVVDLEVERLVMPAILVVFRTQD